MLTIVKSSRVIRNPSETTSNTAQGFARNFVMLSSQLPQLAPRQRTGAAAPESACSRGTSASVEMLGGDTDNAVIAAPERVCVKNVGAIGFAWWSACAGCAPTQPDGKVAGGYGHHHGRDARNAEVRAVTSLDVRLSARRRSPSDAAHATRRTPP